MKPCAKSPTRKAAALLAGVALAFAAPPLLAQAPPGASPAPGNALNPSPPNTSTARRWMYEDGMGTREPSARSPTGRLYEIPRDPGEEEEEKKEGWQASGFVELGALHVRGDAASQGFRTYKDLEDGLYLNNFGVLAEHADRALFVEAFGGGAGRDDQFYRLRAGRYNDWQVSAFYDGTPQVFTTRYRSLWNGVGGAELALAGLTAGGTTNAATTEANIRAAIAAAGDSELRVLRNKGGVRFDKTLGEAWKAYASFTDERREGARPFGAVFGGGGGGGNFELAESIDYSTRDFAAGVQYAGELSSFNLRAGASFFTNGIDALRFENPLYISVNGSSGLAPASFTHGRFALAPDNVHYDVKGEYARALPDFFRGYFTATMALGWQRQDESLLAPTEYELAGGRVSAGGASLENAWNTPAALGRESTDARLDTRLLNLGLTLHPVRGLDVRGRLRYYETRNSTQYFACNPLTGQWGRLLNDGSGLSLAGPSTMARVNPAGTSANGYNAALCDLAAVQALGLVPSAGNIPIASAPNDYRQLVANVSADYRLGRASTVNAALEREHFERDFRERAETWEDRVKLGYVDRGTLDGTIRLSYEHARRRGGDYDRSVAYPFYSASLGPEPASGSVAMGSWLRGNAQFQSLDLADRNRNTLNGRVDYAIRPDMDGALTMRLEDAEYPAPYGRTGRQRTGALTLDLSYQPGPAALVYGYLASQAGRTQQRGIHGNACTLDYTYYFYSDGRVIGTVTGAAPPATPQGTTLVATRDITADNWRAACGTPAADSPLLPESRAWDVTSRDRSNVLGVGLKYDFGRVQLDASFTRMAGRTRIAYAYNAAALGLSSAQVALIGEALPDIVFTQNVLSATLLVPINRNVLLHLLLRHESGRIRDWHYDGLAEDPMPAANAAYLDAGPADYRATLVGVFFQVRM